MTFVTERDEMKAPSTRTSAAWTLTAAGAVAALLMLVFIVENRLVQLRLVARRHRRAVDAALVSGTTVFSAPTVMRRAWRKVRSLFRRLDPGTNAGWSKRTS